MSKVLVTGADGFIGSHLVESLVHSGHNVRAFCIYNSTGSRGWLDYAPPEVLSSVEFLFGDIRDPIFVKNSMKNVNTVYHLAALIAIPYSYIAPASYVDTNIHGTLNIVQAARDLDVERVIHTSTSETYGTAQYIPIDEKHPLVGQSPYAASKIGADQIAMSYWRSFGTPVSIIRPFNTYGPRQSARAVIPTIITQILSGKSTIKLGSITPTRDFNYVMDTCRAFQAIGNSQKTIGRIINSCSQFEISIAETVDLISDLMNAGVTIESEDIRTRPTNSEVNRLYGDNSLLKSLTDWQPQYSGKEGLRRGLAQTIKWFSQKYNLTRYNSDIYSV